MQPSMLRNLGDILQIAWAEVVFSLRTRLLLLLSLVYVGAVGFANALLMLILHELETQLADTLGVPATRRPGAMMQQLLAGDQLTQMLSVFSEDTDYVQALLKIPILAIWAGGVATALLPPLVLLNAAGSVSTEVRSGSIRYLLCRADRSAIAIGKLLGQIGMGVFVALLGVLVTVLMGMTMMVGTDFGALVIGLLNLTGRAICYTLPYAGLGMGASLLLTSPNGARALAIGGFVGMPMLLALRGAWEDVTWLEMPLDMLSIFLAPTCWGPLWSLDWAEFAGGVGFAVALTMIYMAAGYARFTRKDL